MEDLISHIEDVTAHLAPVIIHIEVVTSHIKAVTAHTAPLTVPIAAVKAHTEGVTDHIAAATTNKHPFEPTTTAHDEMAKPFFEKGFTASDPYRLLKQPLNAVSENWVNSGLKSGKLFSLFPG